jgi:hypothetical protein
MLRKLCPRARNRLSQVRRAKRVEATASVLQAQKVTTKAGVTMRKPITTEPIARTALDNVVALTTSKTSFFRLASRFEL